MENFKNEPQSIIDILAENVHVLSLPRLDRFNVYILFEALVDRFPAGEEVELQYSCTIQIFANLFVQQRRSVYKK